ncbi:MAG TPA: DoxX family protein [Polyangiaceae bacterium]|nr:DoxX family protein [Polyangiaceae bacterium]
MPPSKARSTSYWITTSLASLNLLVAGAAYLAGVQVVRDGLAELGYPAVVMTLLGAGKLLGGLALLAPGLPRLKEWAYAGITFNLIGAAASHAVAGHPPTKVIAPLVVLALALASWALRPANRRLQSQRREPHERHDPFAAASQRRVA